MVLKSATMLFCNVEKGNFLYFYAAIFYSGRQSQNKVLSWQLKKPHLILFSMKNRAEWPLLKHPDSKNIRESSIIAQKIFVTLDQNGEIRAGRMFKGSWVGEKLRTSIHVSPHWQNHLKVWGITLEISVCPCGTSIDTLQAQVWTQIALISRNRRRLLWILTCGTDFPCHVVGI